MKKKPVHVRCVMLFAWMTICILFVAGLQQTLANAPPVQEQNAETGWTFTVIEDAKYFAYRTAPDIQYDSLDNPHIAYGGDKLYYAWHDGVSWQVETVDDSPGAGYWAILQLDAADKPVIAYTDSSITLKLAWRTGSDWTIYSLGSIAWQSRPALALDNQGYPHVAYRNYPDFDLAYVYWTGVNWVDQLVPSDPARVSLALDDANHPHIVSSDWDAHTLTYAHWNAGNWYTDTVDMVFADGTSMALDSLGYPHIAYITDSWPQARYAQWDGGQWLTSTIENSVSTDAWLISLELGTNDIPYVLYDSGYWTREGESWNLLGSGCLYCSFSLNQAGEPGKAFYLYNYSDHAYGLGYLTWNEPWEVVDEAGYLNQTIDLDVDSGKRPFVSYFDDAQHRLKIASETITGWHTSEVLPVLRDYGHALAVDSAGQPHLTFSSGSVISYGHRISDTWVFSDVGLGSYYMDLVLDSADIPHVSYSHVGLQHAYWMSDTWNTDLVAPSSGPHCMTLDNVGTFHFANYGNSTLWYISGTASSWSSMAVLTETFTIPTGVLIDQQGYPQIAYTDMTGWPERTGYATYNGSQWDIEDVIEGECSNPVMDSNGTVHLICLSNFVLTHAQRTNEGWSFAPFDGIYGENASLIITEGNKLMFAYHDSRTYDLMLAQMVEYHYQSYLPIVESQ